MNASSNSTFAYTAFGSASSFWLSVTSPYNSSGVYTGGFSTNGYAGEYLTSFFTSPFVATSMTFSNRASSTSCLIKSYVVQGADFAASTFYLLANNTIATPTAGTVTVTFNTAGIPPIYKFYITITTMTGSSDVYMDNINIQGYVQTAASCTYFPNVVEIGSSYGTSYDATTPLTVNGTCRVGNDQSTTTVDTGGLFYYRQIKQPCVFRGTLVWNSQNSTAYTTQQTISGPYVNVDNSDCMVVASNGDISANTGHYIMGATPTHNAGGTLTTGLYVGSIYFLCRGVNTNACRTNYAIFFTPMY